jgi:hypothetical protein
LRRRKLCRAGLLFLFVFRAERFKDKFYTLLALAAFGLSAVITVAVSVAYRQGMLVDRVTLSLSLLVIVLTLSVTAKKSGVKFLFPLQSAAAMWTAHTLSGVVLYDNAWRVVLDIALMLAAFLWARYNIKREDTLSFVAHNAIFAVSLWLVILTSGYDWEFRPVWLLMFALPAIVYAALMLRTR